jgi:NAD(P)H-dependent FMN reductase
MPNPSPSAAAAVSVNVLIVSSSLSGKSRSRKLARFAAEKLAAANVPSAWLDLSLTPLPPAGSQAGWSDPNVPPVKALTSAATHLIFAVPIYNYDVNSVVKNFIELMGEDALGGKTVAFLCSAGGQGSFMAIMGFANSLMLDFRCWIVPRFVYVSEDFGETLPAEIEARIEGLLQDLLSRGGPPTAAA